MITLSHVSKTFLTKSGKVDAVKDVSLQIEQGDIFGIIGFSGAGKSTLVRCINLLETPTSGTVVVGNIPLMSNGIPLESSLLRKARKKIGMIFQQFNLFPARTVFENIAYPLKMEGRSKEEIQDRVRFLLDLVELPDKEYAYPSQLSGGQKQRIAIARALANNPGVLLCDEATSALDPQTTHSILALLKKLNRELDLTIVVITHEMSVVKSICNRVAIMESGCVVEQGDVLEVFSQPKQAVTKAFTGSTSNLNQIYDILENNPEVLNLEPSQWILRLTYREGSVSQAVISDISIQYGVKVSIILADVEMVQQSLIGGIVGIFSGTREQISQAVDSLAKQDILVEVIRDADAH